MTNKTHFGSEVFQYDALSGPLYGAFFAYLGFTIVGFIIFFTFSGVSKMAGGQPDAGMMFGFFAGYIAMLFAMGLGYAFYLHKQLVHFWENTHFQGCKFSFGGTLSEMIKMYLGNFALVIVTLGLAFPITQMRFVRYVMDNMKLDGTLDLAAISQSTEAEPSFGEGLAEGFDMGSI